MILYNMRYRGPYEYDKFILNVMQFANETKRLKGYLGDTSLAELKELEKQLTKIIDEETKVDSTGQKLLALRIQRSIKGDAECRRNLTQSK